MYEPKPFSGNITQYVQDEFQSVAQSQNDLINTQTFDARTAAPAKPRTGMVAYANHTNWTPSHGAGLHEYTGSAWKKLGPVTGRATLVGGTVDVTLASVTANTNIFLTCQVPGGTPGFLRVSARSAGVNFTILSSSGTDTSTVAYLVIEP